MQWKLTSSKWRPHLLGFVSSLDDIIVKSTLEKAFRSLSDVSKVVVKLTVSKGIGSVVQPLPFRATRDVVAPFRVVVMTTNRCS
ncbi:hypothetical protein DEO72_LG7g2187 [Vigna unguiculata]|uniref:Uncharacterized protein n=1 Tax=Vigna unguiculata TaxID=3917 RepID=A0A4D6MHI5_VIGUN|nr:hypothetical protein DEO72_LG7g2187 [Vigna unguiculata]